MPAASASTPRASASTPATAASCPTSCAGSASDVPRTRVYGFPPTRIGEGPDAHTFGGADNAQVIDVARGSYAVVWDEGDGRRHTGRLDILEGGLHLEGRSRTDRWRSRHISFAEVRSVAIGRSAAERIDGRRCLVLELTGSRPLRILALGGSQMLNELADLFARPHVNGSGG